ncbi:chemotaxis protein CheD [Insolitispirillum peregrinum]|uniref:chemotaxis protein CheD n=1 Tax=Insolitispirillum peregrinum TaxID=80876 RepID=UPI00360E6320
MSATAPTLCSLSPESGLEHHLPSSFLHPGEVFASATPHVITTILGSCVAMCLFDPLTGIGGMNHFAIPRSAAHDPLSTRAAAGALHTLLARLEALGARRRTLQVKLFGGNSVLSLPDRDDPEHPMTGSRPHVGQANVAIARALLAEHHLPVVRELVMNPRGMMLKMVTATGDVWVRPVHTVRPALPLAAVR